MKGFKDNKMIRIVFLNNPSGSDMEDKLEQMEPGGTVYYQEAFALS